MSIAVASPRPLPAFSIGRTFVHPLFDLFVIGGLLTVPVALFTTLQAGSAAAFLGVAAPVIFLFCNQAHFAASTFRLYTKPRSFQDLPFLTMGFPAVTFLVVAGFIAFADQVGHHFQALYLTWSPYHYAAQTFGLASMYSYRSGCRLDERERWMLRAACLLPFGRAFIGGAPFGHGLGWFVPYMTLVGNDTRFAVMSGILQTFGWASMLAPLAFFVLMAYRSRTVADEGGSRAGLPLLAVVLMLSNAAWWSLFPYWDAVVWATILHGIQYLGIMAIFHSQEQVQRPDNRHGRAWHVGVLLLTCIALGYGLFQCWPRAYMWAGYGKVESMYMVIAAINIHHFIVDAYIWKIRKDPNYRTVVA